MSEWKFYGRVDELAALERILLGKGWFFAKMTGRRRIGKTRLIQRAMEKIKNRRPVFYVQIPDSEPMGVLSTVADSMDAFHVPQDKYPRPPDLLRFAKTIEAMATDGYILILDEFQYFNRKPLYEFCSYLQAAVDRLSTNAHRVKGGLIALGSLHTELTAILEDRSAPLYNRTTHSLQLGHLDFASVLAILREHADTRPERLLFLWTMFEGVPKYYRDCFDQRVFKAPRDMVLKRLFFLDSAPLRSEVDNWFLRELRGRYDVLLKYVARNPGCSHGDLTRVIREGSKDSETQVGGYLKHLVERFGVIERRQPICARNTQKKGRYYVTDNFLRAWLAALAKSVSAIQFLSVADSVREADERLATVEGHALEKMAGLLYEERSRKNLGDFRLSARVEGYWDKGDTEIDLVALSQTEKVIRFGTCKRSPEKLMRGLKNLTEHADRFLRDLPEYQSWKHEYVGISPALDKSQRKVLEARGVIPQDLNDLTAGL